MRTSCVPPVVLVVCALLVSAPAGAARAHAAEASAAPRTAPRTTPRVNLSISRSTRLLVVSPHPDDEALAAAGLIARVVHAGGQVRVVLVTSGDAFSEGVEREGHIARPTASDYRHYGTLRESETIAAMRALGVDRGAVTFLGFPDDGLCLLASKYLSVKAASFESPYTRRDSPPDGEQIIDGVHYRGADLRREIERVLVAFRPTLLVAPHPQDEHPDHCSTHIFVREALAALSHDPSFVPPRILHYVIHYGRWPLAGGDAVRGQLRPPAGFPAAEGTWRTLRLSRREAAAKRQALAAYASQTLVIGPFMQGFTQRNELFLEGEPAAIPACWCGGANVATDAPASAPRGAPPRP